MNLTSATKATAVSAAMVMLAGLATILHATVRDDLPRAICGLTLTVTALTAIGLLVIRRWVTDTRDARRDYADAQRRTESQKDSYLAAQAGLENERGRLALDVAAERAQLAARLKAEREAMEAEFEKRRGDLIAETMEATVLMYRGGKFAPDATVAGKLIRFPEQHPHQQPDRARSREHGVVGPR